MTLYVESSLYASSGEAGSAFGQGRAREGNALRCCKEVSLSSVYLKAQRRRYTVLNTGKPPASLHTAQLSLSTSTIVVMEATVYTP